jgi:hypothetical protein
LSAGAQRQRMAQIRAVSRLSGPGWIIDVLEDGRWLLDVEGTRKPLGVSDRYRTSLFIRRSYPAS